MTIYSTNDVEDFDICFFVRNVFPASVDIVKDLGFSKTSEPKSVELLFDK